jgi:hypothetical protein
LFAFLAVGCGAVVVTGVAAQGPTDSTVMMAVLAVILVWFAVLAGRLAYDNGHSFIEIGSAGLRLRRHGAEAVIVWDQVKRVDITLVYPVRPAAQQARPGAVGKPVKEAESPKLPARKRPTVKVFLAAEAAEDQRAVWGKAMSAAEGGWNITLVHLPLRSEAAAWGVDSLVAAAFAYGGRRFTGVRSVLRD